MICIAVTLIGIIGFGTCAEVGLVPLDAMLKSESVSDVNEMVDGLVEVIGDRLNITTLKAEIAAIKTDLINLRKDLTHCVTGWNNFWAIKDGSWTSRTIYFSRSFLKKPQVMVAVMGAGKGRYMTYCPQAIDFDIKESMEVSKSSFTIQAMTNAMPKLCDSKSYLYFSYIACGTY